MKNTITYNTKNGGSQQSPVIFHHFMATAASSIHTAKSTENINPTRMEVFLLEVQLEVIGVNLRPAFFRDPEFIFTNYEADVTLGTRCPES